MLQRTVGFIAFCLPLYSIFFFIFYFFYLLYLDPLPRILMQGEVLVLGTTLHAHMEVMKRWYGLSSTKTKHKFL